MAEPFNFSIDNLMKKQPKANPISAKTPTGAPKTPLRKPKLEITGATNMEVLNTTAEKLSLSSLSVDAPVFVPKSINTQPLTPQLDTHSEESNIIYQVQDILSTVVCNPGNFDKLMQELLETLNQSLSKQSTLDEMVETIFNMSIETRNLSYLGSRMCDFLSKNFSKTIEDKTFRKLLMARVQQEFNNKDHLIKNSVDRLQKFTLFMAELFSNMEILSGNTAVKIGILAKALTELLNALLDSPFDNNVICVINCLKLTGFSLEEYNKDASKPADLSTLYAKLENMASDSQYTKNIQERILSLIKLKNSNWGQEVSQDSLSNVAAASLENFDQPVFYGPEGQLSAEELGFYDECFTEQYEEYAYDEYGYNQEWDAVQDDSIPKHFMNKDEEDAYELFLQQSIYK